MVYLYQTSRGKIVEKDFPGGQAPSEIHDPKRGKLTRYYGGYSVHIPDHMKALGSAGDNKIDYEHKRTKTVF